MNKAIPEKLSDLLKAGKVTIFSVSYCPYCTTALSILQKLKIDYQMLECDTENLSSQQISDLHKFSGFRTYPKIYVGLNLVGGCDDMRSKIANGKFYELLNAENIVYTKAKL